MMLFLTFLWTWSLKRAQALCSPPLPYTPPTQVLKGTNFVKAVPSGLRKVLQSGRQGMQSLGNLVRFEGPAARSLKLVDPTRSALVLEQKLKPAVEVVQNRAVDLKSPVRWIDEKASMNPTARYYNDSVVGARSNAHSKLSQAPSLEYSGVNNKPSIVRFDGKEGNVLIDRKVAIVTTDKSKGQALRQSEALRQNSLRGRWEVPNATQQLRAEKMLEELKITNIEVNIVNVSQFK